MLLVLASDEYPDEFGHIRTCEIDCASICQHPITHGTLILKLRWKKSFYYQYKATIGNDFLFINRTTSSKQISLTSVLLKFKEKYAFKSIIQKSNANRI